MWKEFTNIWKSNTLLDQAWNESFEMLEIDRRMYLEAVRVLRDSDDLELNEDIRKLDKKVNKYERDVRRKVMTHCSVSGPSELPSGMALVSIVIDIERIGDYCKNIVDLAANHPRRLKANDFESELVSVERSVRTQFDETIEVLRSHDADKARKLMQIYTDDTAAICDRLVNDLVAGKVGDQSPADAAALALYIRYLKRIASHLKNMVTSVVNPFHRIGFKEKK
jgi:phosphate uptake regulator